MPKNECFEPQNEGNAVYVREKPGEHDEVYDLPRNLVDNRVVFRKLTVAKTTRIPSAWIPYASNTGCDGAIVRDLKLGQISHKLSSWNGFELQHFVLKCNDHSLDRVKK